MWKAHSWGYLSLIFATSIWTAIRSPEKCSWFLWLDCLAGVINLLDNRWNLEGLRLASTKSQTYLKHEKKNSVSQLQVLEYQLWNVEGGHNWRIRPELDFYLNEKSLPDRIFLLSQIHPLIGIFFSEVGKKEGVCRYSFVCIAFYSSRGNVCDISPHIYEKGYIKITL